VSRVIKEQKLAALGRMVSFETHMLPVLVVGDAEKLRTVVDNLVSNAIKYSPRSGTIRIDVAATDGDAVLDVIDEGPGVSPEDRTRVFDSFYQGPAPADGRIKGSGLGLAIAREYALAHGGRIEVTGRDDGRSGAWFKLSLPLAMREAAPRARETAVLLAEGK
jgi:two-component system sensor histidine kinase GlrK